MNSKSISLGAICVSLTAIVMGAVAKSPNPSSPTIQEPDAKAAWVTSIADDFVQSWISTDAAVNEMLVSEPLRQRFEKYTQCPSLASTICTKSASGYQSYKIERVQFSPNTNEARFSGMIAGTRNDKSFTAPFVVRVSEQDTIWRVSYFWSGDWKYDEEEGRMSK